MKYGELLEKLYELSPAQLNCDVTIEDPSEGECFPTGFYVCDNEHDSLDPDHPILYMAFDCDYCSS